MRKLGAFSVIICAIFLNGLVDKARGDEAFYKGRVVTLMLSTSPGGGYDALARVVTKHMQRHLPGASSMSIQYYPGAAGVRAANYLYTLAPKDGSMIGLIHNLVAFEPLLGNEAARFDPRHFGWLGSPSHETGILMVMQNAAATTLKQLESTPITTAVEANDSTSAYHARLFAKTLNLRLKLVPGYVGGSEVLLAMERGEIDSFANFYRSIRQTRPAWLKDKKVHLLAYFGPVREATLGDVPYLDDIVTDAENKALVSIASSQLALGLPFMTPPNLPPARLAVLRSALANTFADPEFVADAARTGLGEINPRKGQELADAIDRIYSAPPDVVRQLRELSTGK